MINFGFSDQKAKLMLSQKRIVTVVIILFASCIAPLISAAEIEATDLHAILQSDAPIHKKAVACKQLAVVGTSESIPILAGFLSDERLSHYARFGLEAIPDPAVDDAFRNALDNIEGNQLIGVINSIGARRDTQAVDRLSSLLQQDDARIASAAAAALGQIANDKAASALTTTLESQTAQNAIADASLACAGILLDEGQQERAIEIYDAVRQSSVPKQFQIAATYSAILARESSALPLVKELLQSPDDEEFAITLQASRKLPDGGLSQALIDSLENADSPRQTLLIAALGDLGNRESLPVLMEAARSESQAQRVAAIRGLQSIGDGSAVKLLLEAAHSNDPATAAAAAQALEKIPGTDVDRTIEGELSHATSDDIKLLIQLAGHRRIAAAVPALWAAAESTDQSVRHAAIQALGETLTTAELDQLVDKVVAEDSAEERAVLVASLKAACFRQPDRDGTVEKVIARLADKPVAMQVLLLELLRDVGGEAALDHVVAAASDSRDAIQDAATRVLGEWLTVDVAPKLLELSDSLDNQKYQIRALRGYIRVIRQFGLPLDERLEMSRKALAAAERNDEKILVLQALVRFSADESLALAIDQLNKPGLTAVAAQTAVSIAERMVANDKEGLQKAMQQILQARVNQDVKDRAQTILDKSQ